MVLGNKLWYFGDHPYTNNRFQSTIILGVHTTYVLQFYKNTTKHYATKSTVKNVWPTGKSSPKCQEILDRRSMQF